MKDISKRKPKVRCDACGSSDIRINGKSPVDRRPLFICGSCGQTWSNGRSGGKYLMAALANKNNVVKQGLHK